MNRYTIGEIIILAQDSDKEEFQLIDLVDKDRWAISNPNVLGKKFKSAVINGHVKGVRFIKLTKTDKNTRYVKYDVSGQA